MRTDLMQQLRTDCDVHKRLRRSSELEQGLIAVLQPLTPKQRLRTLVSMTSEQAGREGDGDRLTALRLYIGHAIGDIASNNEEQRMLARRTALTLWKATPRYSKTRLRLEEHKSWLMWQVFACWLAIKSDKLAEHALTDLIGMVCRRDSEAGTKLLAQAIAPTIKGGIDRHHLRVARGIKRLLEKTRHKDFPESDPAVLLGKALMTSLDKSLCARAVWSQLLPALTRVVKRHQFPSPLILRG